MHHEIISHNTIITASEPQYCTTLIVTVTEALVLRPLLEDRGHITESIRILVLVDRMKQKCFQIHGETSPSIAAVSAPSVLGSLFNARGAATEKALSPVHRRVCGTTRLPLYLTIHNRVKYVD